jgi:hypothetical protein
MEPAWDQVPVFEASRPASGRPVDAQRAHPRVRRDRPPSNRSALVLQGAPLGDTSNAAGGDSSSRFSDAQAPIAGRACLQLLSGRSRGWRHWCGRVLGPFGRTFDKQKSEVSNREEVSREMSGDDLKFVWIRRLWRREDFQPHPSRRVCSVNTTWWVLWRNIYTFDRFVVALEADIVGSAAISRTKCAVI